MLCEQTARGVAQNVLHCVPFTMYQYYIWNRVMPGRPEYNQFSSDELLKSHTSEAKEFSQVVKRQSVNVNAEDEAFNIEI